MQTAGAVAGGAIAALFAAAFGFVGGMIVGSNNGDCERRPSVSAPPDAAAALPAQRGDLLIDCFPEAEPWIDHGPLDADTASALAGAVIRVCREESRLESQWGWTFNATFTDASQFGTGRVYVQFTFCNPLTRSSNGVYAYWVDTKKRTIAGHHVGDAAACGMIESNKDYSLAGW